MSWKKIAAMAALTSLFLGAPAARSQQSPVFDTGLIPSPHILMPDGPVGAAIVLLSDAGGWSDKENTLAQSLKASGAVVIGIDLPSYLAALVKDEDDCVYMVSDIEALSQQVQRAAKNNDYRLPIVAGVGAGGAVALAIAAQTPPATIGQTLAADPQAAIPLKRELCTPADKTVKGEGMIYGLTDGPLPNPVTVLFSNAATADGRDHVTTLVAKHSDIEVQTTDDEVWAAFTETLSQLATDAANDDNPLGLPLTILDADPTRDTMAIVYSGDGGWRDIDKETGDILQQQGMPVVGLDSLRYFWAERQPQETADDLKRIIDLYSKRWNVRHVLLIGYSFGADVLPRTYNLLPRVDQDRIRQITLMALSHQVDYKISVLGWLGATGDGSGGDPVTDLKQIAPEKIQCIYGTDDDGDACPTLKGTGVDVIAIDGGHHFDEDYPALAKRILDGYDQRMKAAPKP